MIRFWFFFHTRVNCIIFIFFKIDEIILKGCKYTSKHHLKLETTKEIRLTEYNYYNYFMVYILSWKFSIHRDTCHIDVMSFMLRKNPHKDYLKGRLKFQLADISKLTILTEKSISGVDNHGIE